MAQKISSVISMLLLSIIGMSVAAQNGSSVASVTSIEAALRRQDYTTALDLARTALKRQPNQARILTLEGIAFSALGRESEALSAFRQALKIEPDSLAALEGAAQIEFNSGDTGAEVLLRRIVLLRPEEPTSHAMLASLAYRRHDCREAVAQFDRAKAVIAQEPAALTEYGACLVDQNRAKEAVAEAQQALAIKPEDTGLRYNLAVAQQSAHMSQEAIQTLKPLIETASPDPDVLDLAAAAYEDQEETPEAVRLLRAALIANPRELKYYMDFAALALKHSSWQVGIDVVNLGIKQLPNTAALYVARGIFYVQQENFAAARSDFEAANRLDPAQTGGTIAQGMAAIQQHDPTQALAAIEAQLQVHPDDAFLQYLKALALKKNGVAPGSPEFAQAIKAARKAADSKNGFEVAHDLLAEMYLETGDWAGAEEQSRLALAQDPSDEKAVYHLIQAVRKSGQDPHGELPELTKRMTALLARKRDSETTENRYRLYEPQADTAPRSSLPQ